MGRKFLNVILASVAVFSACTVTDTPAPPLQGPSELALSLTTTANPDTISQDGASQSLIVVQAYDANGQPARNIPFRAEILFGGVATDFGTLSARSLVTDNNGRASVTYTAPPMITSVDANVVVTIRLTPSAGDFANTTPRFVAIRLVPPGTILPGGPTPNFTVSPAAPAAFRDVLFDASTSTPAVGTTIARFNWTFGDGGTASGQVVPHTFSSAGTFLVTLTVTDSNGISNSRSQFVTVTGGTPPTASFVFSPSAPTVLQEIFFNAGNSTAAAGRTIVRYDWNFGSGAPQSGRTVSKSYDVAGTYNVQLTVTDDVGQTGVATQSVIVTQPGGVPSGLTAAFTTSPSAPLTGTPITFNGSGSTFQPGFPIVSYDWDFGDGVTASGPSSSVTHAYSTAGTYVARLTIRDTLGRTATITNTVSVTAGAAQPTAVFTFSPSPARVNQTITFDARNSTAPAGSTIDHYEWSWGDGSPIESDTGSNEFHAYSRAGTFTVTLTVVDSLGRRGNTSQSVVVQQ